MGLTEGRIRIPKWGDAKESEHQRWCVALLVALGFESPIYVTDQGVRVLKHEDGSVSGDPRGTRTTAGQPDISYGFHLGRGLLVIFEVKPPKRARALAGRLERGAKNKAQLKEYRNAGAQQHFGALARRLGEAVPAIRYGYGSLPELLASLLGPFTVPELTAALKRCPLPFDLHAEALALISRSK
jgi:hypothetical protein